MSDPFSSAGPGESERVNPPGVRTYRGRTIEELIPRIRAELGPDAIILREREGLTGGIGGFFAQRCVEIDAQAAARVNVYAGDEDDDDLEDWEDEEELDDELGVPDMPWADADLQATREQPALPPAPEESLGFGAPAAPMALAAAPQVDELTTAPPAPAASSDASAPSSNGSMFDEASFAARLEEATLSVEAVDPGPEEQAPATAAPGVREMFIAFDELGDEAAWDEPRPQAAPDEGEPEPAPGEGEAEPEPAFDEGEPKPEPEPLDPSAPWMTMAAEPLTAQAGPDAAPVRPAPPHIADAAPMSQASPMPRPPTASPPAPEIAPKPLTAPAQPPPPPAAVYHQPYPPRRRGGLLPVAERMLRAALDATAAANERRSLQPLQYAPAPAVPALVDPPTAVPVREGSAAPEASMLERRLVRAGISRHRAASLVATAAARRGGAGSTGDLTTDLRAMIAEALPVAPTLPTDQGAIAIVGAGGSGKTHSVASLAAAHARAGHTVSVASHGGPIHDDELGELLHGESVNVIPAMRTRATARAITSARQRGLVIVDTGSASPGNGEAIDASAAALETFGLDAILLAVPATLSSTAALKLVDSFSAIELTGMVATRLDEVDALGVVVELAIQTGLPLALTHTGLDLQQSISSADPVGIASTLL